MSNSNGFQGVSNCYVFKSRLQEYAQKKGLLTPVYETLKEGPSHEPHFKSYVTVNGIRYESLTGFFNRKASEQSAAEVALLEIAKSENKNDSIKYPVHETGLCKNLLQEYAQKMNYAIPSYICQNDDQVKGSSFFCAVEIGGIQYIGTTAKTKKEAEIKAARTALLAIQSSTSGSEVNPSGNSQLTVLPCKKKGPESTNTVADKTKKLTKPKKANFKKKWPRKNFPNAVVLGNTANTSLIQFQSAGMLVTCDQGMETSGSEIGNVSGNLAINANLNTRLAWNKGPENQDISGNLAIDANPVTQLTWNEGSEIRNVSGNSAIDANSSTELIRNKGSEIGNVSGNLAIDANPSTQLTCNKGSENGNVLGNLAIDANPSTQLTCNKGSENGNVLGNLAIDANMNSLGTWNEGAENQKGQEIPTLKVVSGLVGSATTQP